MKRIRADLMFERNSEADEVWQTIKNYMSRKKVKSLTEEKSFIEYEECHHDETPARPCEIIEKFVK